MEFLMSILDGTMEFAKSVLDVVTDFWNDLDEDKKKLFLGCVVAGVAIIAVANKLIRQMFAVVTNNRPYIDGYVSSLA